MVISIGGLGSQIALNIIDSTRQRQIISLREQPEHERAASAFRERIASISTPAELVKDFEVYSFVMKAFDLEEQIFGKGMIRKVLESDPSDETSLVNRLTDPRFGELHAAMGFTTENGPTDPGFDNPVWVEQIVERYFNRVFVNDNAAQNDTVGNVLHFREEVADIDNWYDVLKDTRLTDFFQVALGLPKELAGLEVDAQKLRYEEKLNIADLKDPKVREDLEAKYIAISDVRNPPQTLSGSRLASLFNPVGIGAQFVPLTLEISPVTFSASSLYR